MNSRHLLFPLASLALAMLLPLDAHAERYRIDLVVFLDRGGSTAELPKPFAPPDLTRALEPDAASLAGKNIELLPEAAFGMPEVWNRLRTSRRYQPLLKMAWLQNDPPADRSLPLHVHSGAPILLPAVAGQTATPTASFQTVDGTIALRLSRYLYVDVDLAYTQPLPDGRLASHRLKEVRKMKRDELHYLDSPKLGVVARVTKAALVPTAPAVLTAPAAPTPPVSPPKR